MRLNELKRGESAIITKVLGRGAFRKRIQEMGFIAGKEIRVLHEAPMKDPVEYQVMGYNVSLRRAEAGQIEVITQSEAQHAGEQAPVQAESLQNGALLRASADAHGKTINVALIGNPNSGKTSLFNHASGARERVGNYSGVTIEAKEATYRHDGYTFRLIDMPGSYSLTAYSPEELYIRDHILEAMPDVVVNVVDATNLERNLYLTSQLIDMDIRVVIALNMYDEFGKQGHMLDIHQLERILGIPVVPTVGRRGEGLGELFRRIKDVYLDRDTVSRTVSIQYGEDMEKAIGDIREAILADPRQTLSNRISGRFLAIKLLEKDSDIEKRLMEISTFENVLNRATAGIRKIEKSFREDSEAVVTGARYGFIAGALRETLVLRKREKRRKTEIIDNIVTHRAWGIPFFFLFIFLMFFATFKLGEYPVMGLEWLVAASSRLVGVHMADGMLKDLIAQGIIGGVGGVLVFLPNILILYFFISLMEDSGYMARTVFIMDKFMHRIGLHGKSFIPLLMGFGCNVPAIMSTRIIESKRDRLVTMLINPFMSCSARLPVFILLISAFFTNYRSGVLFMLYLTGILLAVISAMIFKRTIIRGPDIPFVMELPPYRIPTFRTIVRHMWHRTEQYLRKIGMVIMVASVIIWALGYFPRSNDKVRELDGQIAMLEQQREDGAQQGREIESQLRTLELQREAERQSGSYIGVLGRTLQPVLRPLGFDWKMSVSLITGIAAKEVVVGTLGVLYPQEENTEDPGLVVRLREAEHESGVLAGSKVFRPLTAMSFMLFILLYFPCIGVVSAIRKESGRWGWALFAVFYTTSVAWLVSFMVFQAGKLMGF